MSVQYKPPKKVNPLMPVFGLLIALGLAVIAYILAVEVVRGIPDLRNMKQGFRVGGELVTWATVVVAGGIWVVMLTFSYLVVAILAGRDPNDTSKMKLPPRKIQPKKRDD